MSIVLCAYNSERVIARALESLLAQDYPADLYEIVVVNDGSTDDTAQIVAEYPVRLVSHATNLGRGAARNTGLGYVKGDVYVCTQSPRSVLILLVAVTAIVACASSPPPSQLIQVGDSKANCIYAQIGTPLRLAEQATGITYSCVETFSNTEPTRADWSDPWVISSQHGYKEWLAADSAARQVVLTQNLIPDSEGSNPNWTSQCAAGDFDNYAALLASNLVKAGFGYSVIRLGAEMNGTWNVGSLGSAMGEWKQWGACFAREVQAMREVPGSHLLFDWDVNANYRDIPLAAFYPGNAYVDIIGVDAYDTSGMPLPHVGSPERWAKLVSEPEGLDAIRTFAVAHGKPLSIPEWGTVATEGDDANYVTNIGAFVANNDVAFQAWFDAGDNHIDQLSRSEAPLSLTAYVKAFG
jgi:Glycosyl transferase family 2/Glycosyl hydrolase family 26